MGDDVPGTSGFSVHNVLTNSVYRLLRFRREVIAMAETHSSALRSS
jgi:hypothetical protein